MDLERYPEDEISSPAEENQRLRKGIYNGIVGVILIWLALWVIVALSGCNCYFTMVHTQGHASDVVDDMGTNTPNISPIIPIPVGVM